MPVLLLFLLFRVYRIPTPDLLDFMANVSSPFHNFCQEQWETSRHFATNTALFCGAGIETDGLRESLVGAGLYHLALFSGFHMGFLESLCRRSFGQRSWVAPAVLGLFALLSGWPGRVVRAFVRSLLRSKHSSPRTLLMHSWLFCIALHPPWIHSLSLHLSAAAGLAFLGGSRSWLWTSLKVFVLLTPLFAGWAPLHPWIPLAGIVLAPFALALWTLEALVEFVHPRGLDFLNRADEALRTVLQALDQLHPAWTPFRSGSEQWGWFYLVLLFCLLHGRELRAERQKQRAPR